MNERIPARWLVLAAMVLLVTPCALVGLAGLMPEEGSEENLAAVILPVIIGVQAAFLFWYYRHSTKR